LSTHELAPASRDQERVVAEFRANAGKVGGFHQGMPLLLLTTRGARTGQRRATPLTYLPDGDRYVVAAAAGGATAHPAWYHNLAASAEATVEVGEEVFEATVTVAAGGERSALYQRCADAYPQLLHYQSLTSREVPIVVIRRRASS
jgi:deazaflavin-dependent oxidoreductase (nitroreductase family)